MNPAVERLTKLVPPLSVAAPRDWADVQARLGHALPEDYKQLVEAYGGGVFDETVWLLEPDCAAEDYDLLTQTKECDELLAMFWKGGQAKPVQLETEGARVVPWAYIEGSGHLLYWFVQPGQKPEEWTVALNEGRGPEWEWHDQSCAEFLVAVLTGEGTSLYFDDLPLGDHQFESNSGIL
ncbi:SMI1/KNR4 family protein [Streptomyces sp. NPDC059874]|uniref:SMI1/KNR4 family protein n=1 Tax=Streptomyces sp. NPDC059874 TaxID=3346983 RepID=UPI0036608CF1